MTTMNSHFFRGALLLIGIVILVQNFTQPASAEALLKPDEKSVVKLGNGIYQELCASCHGKNLKGQPNWQTPDADGLLPAPPHDKTGHTWHHTDALLFKLTKFGIAKIANLKDHKTSMPIYDGVLSDEEIIAVLSYIKSTWPENIRKRHDQRN
ncbi:MAG: cytochrome c [Rhizobiaceae bacterium]